MLELLHEGVYDVVVGLLLLLLLRVGVLRWWWRGLVRHLYLRCREDPPDAVDELECVGLRPEVYIDGVEPVVVFILVLRVVSR